MKQKKTSWYFGAFCFHTLTTEIIHWFNKLYNEDLFDYADVYLTSNRELRQLQHL